MIDGSPTLLPPSIVLLLIFLWNSLTILISLKAYLETEEAETD